MLISTKNATIEPEKHMGTVKIFAALRGRLPESRFNENVYQIKADIFLSPDLGLMNYLQFDDISNTLGWSARVRWQISPGNEIFLVYNKNWERRWDPAGRFAPLGDRGVIKIALSIRP